MRTEPEYIFRFRVDRTGAKCADVAILARTLDEAKRKFIAATNLQGVVFDLVSMEEVGS